MKAVMIFDNIGSGAQEVDVPVRPWLLAGVLLPFLANTGAVVMVVAGRGGGRPVKDGGGRHHFHSY